VRGRRSFVGAVLLCVGVLAGACTSLVAGPQPTAGGWRATPLWGQLSGIPAAGHTFEIDLLNAGTLNGVDAAAKTPLPTTAASGQRPAAEFAWSRYALAIPACVAVQQATLQGPWTNDGPLRFALNVVSGERYDAGGVLSTCTGPYRATSYRTSPSSGTASATGGPVAGVTGVVANGQWVGYRADVQTLYTIGGDIPPGTMSTLLSGGTVSQSLADDPRVQAVLDATATSATVSMGTYLPLYAHRSSPGNDIDAAVQAAEQASGKQLDQSQFGGIGWGPRGAGLAGITTFVTVYSSADRAADAAAVLTALWSGGRLARQFGGAVTTANGLAVVTTVPVPDAHTFDLQTLRALDYPGF
jgi:hypothetical protein